MIGFRKPTPEPRAALVAHYCYRLRSLGALMHDAGPAGSNTLPNHQVRLIGVGVIATLRELSDLGAEEEAYSLVASHPAEARRLIRQWTGR